jgi:hypothetical protein
MIIPPAFGTQYHSFKHTVDYIFNNVIYQDGNKQNNEQAKEINNNISDIAGKSPFKQ